MPQILLVNQMQSRTQTIAARNQKARETKNKLRVLLMEGDLGGIQNEESNKTQATMMI